MSPDLDQIISRLRTEIPGVRVTRLEVAHPGADDDGLWFIEIPGRIGQVQIESPDGMCPFLIESDLTEERFHGECIEDVVSTLKSLLRGQHKDGMQSADLAQSLRAIDQGLADIAAGRTREFREVLNEM